MAREDYGKLLFVCGCLPPVFDSFTIRRVARAAASRRGSSPLRLSPDSLLRRLRSLYSERAHAGLSSRALLRSVLCCFRAEARGASFASLRAAGLRLAQLNPDCISTNRSRPEHLFPPPFRVAASCIFQSAAEFANNSVVCHSEEQSDEESVTLPRIDSSLRSE